MKEAAKQFKYNLLAIIFIVFYAFLAAIHEGVDDEEVNQIGNMIMLVIGGEIGVNGVKAFGSRVINKSKETYEQIADMQPEVKTEYKNNTVYGLPQ